MASIVRKFSPLQHHAERGDIADESPPTIDLRGGRADAVDEEMVREVATACAEWGFSMVRGYDALRTNGFVFHAAARVKQCTPD